MRHAVNTYEEISSNILIFKLYISTKHYSLSCDQLLLYAGKAITQLHILQ